MINIGFIGAGGIAQRHMQVLSAFDDVRLVACADQDYSRAQAMAGLHAMNAYPNYQAMLDQEALDGVYVCVPPYAHGPIELELAARRLPFFVEKPVAVDWDTAAHIGQAVAASGIITAVGYHWRYLDSVDQAQALLANNPAHLALGYWLDATPPPAWWQRSAGSGGQLIEQATHIVDLMRLCMGEVVEVTARGVRRPREAFPDMTIHSSSVVLCTFASGAVGTLAASCMLRWPHRIGLHLVSDGMMLELSEHELMIDTGQGRPITPAREDPFRREDRAFVDALVGHSNQIRVTYAEALHTHYLVTCMALALETATTIQLDPDCIPAAPAIERGF